MRDLFITKNVVVKREAKMLKIEDKERKHKKIPVNLINNVFCFGGVELTTGARNLLLEYGKSIYFFSHKAKFLGVLHNAKLGSNYNNRLVQYRHIESLDLAKFIVKYKIEMIEAYLKRSLQRYKEKLNSAKNLNEVLGVEGNCSLYFFEKLKEEFRKIGIDEFKKREYRPVNDRVNGLLSFTYSLFYSFLHTIVLSEGFDPYIGFLHRKRGKHMAFVSDVMEGYRVVLSVFVLKMFEKELRSDDFDGIFLNYEGRRKFIRRYIDLLEEIEYKKFLYKIKEELYRIDNVSRV